MRHMSKGLDRLYRLCGYLAGLSVVAMLGVIVAQIVMRWAGTTFPGATGYAGYLMGTGTFFALSYTFHDGGHIRVGLLIERAGRLRPLLEVWCLLVAASIAGFVAWHAWDATYWSYRFGDVSSGQDATPLWIPQALLTAGAIVFTLCLFDHLCRTLSACFRPTPTPAEPASTRSC
ncbi:TRAP transporter small permease [Modicisalibacter coralii]|uniref:TRAP transporter small permease n=1 Tax=Modicisalibacter coralii TaxID=2304602 RepID=UPI00100B6DAF|nr:TRAP transporter small permease [Halomonas coralii]